ncbi:TadE/TadG family type IV pilus assembly protein [Sulfitobacter sp.]|uniref:TadE/TadG family type IV pilus assembly protein n=1 Tax=Sulfitobacter sp. TaxID=1903071 RepID=UPI003299BAB2
MARLNLARFYRSETGAVAVEFVLIAPILFALLFGIITLGYFMGVSHSVNEVAAGAARASVAGLDQTEREALADAYIREAHRRYPLLDQDAITETLTYEGASPAGISVAVTYDIDGSLLDIANGFLGLGLTAIKRSAYVAY